MVDTITDNYDKGGEYKLHCVAIRKNKISSSHTSTIPLITPVRG